MTTIFVLLISYQNFSKLNSKDWDSLNSVEIIHEMQSFEQTDHQIYKTSEALAVPQSGNNLQSVRSDWMQRQASVILNGYDKKLEAALNEKLNSWVYGSAPTTDAAQKTEVQETKKTQRNLRFSRINSLNYDLGEKTCMNLTADPGNTRFNLSETLTLKAKIGIEHRTADSQTQLFLKYEW
ncbi:MAG: hypothetical protein ACXWRE_00720 [Pseudobdellovibrionaceae bacterium]